MLCFQLPYTGALSELGNQAGLLATTSSRALHPVHLPSLPLIRMVLLWLLGCSTRADPSQKFN